MTRPRVAPVALALAFAVATCGGSNKKLAEPQLGGGESPYAFHRAIGLTLLRTEQPRRALPHLQRLARLQPDNAEPLYYLGRAYLAMRMPEQARSVLDRAISVAPKYAPARAMLGVLLDTRGEHMRAEAEHMAALELEPNNASYHNNLGFCRYLQGRYPLALEALRAALKLDPSMRRVHNNLGFVYGKLGQVARAREHFRLAGNVAEADNNLGLVYEDRGDLERAYQAYLGALVRAPELTAARGNLERVCQQLGKPVPEIPTRRDDHDATPQTRPNNAKKSSAPTP